MQAKTNLSSELKRLARFGANVSDSFSCFLFLPTSYSRFASGETAEILQGANDQALHIVGYHSLSNDVIENCTLPIEAGLVGWVAKHGRSIHVSPFDRDSRTLGIYREDQELKSFIAVPAPLDGEGKEATRFGVVACDSKKAFAFSKLQGKLIEDLAEQLGALVRLSARADHASGSDLTWGNFIASGSTFAQTVGLPSLGILRVKPLNFTQLEQSLSIPSAIKLFDQVIRLIRQTLPPGTPLCRLPSGELIMAVDNMMLSFYESRIEAVASHANERGNRMLFEYSRFAPRSRRGSAGSFEGLVHELLTGELAASAPAQASLEKGRYEYRRA